MFSRIISKALWILAWHPEKNKTSHNLFVVAVSLIQSIFSTRASGKASSCCWSGVSRLVAGNPQYFCRLCSPLEWTAMDYDRLWALSLILQHQGILLKSEYECFRRVCTENHRRSSSDNSVQVNAWPAIWSRMTIRSPELQHKRAFSETWRIWSSLHGRAQFRSMTLRTVQLKVVVLFPFSCESVSSQRRIWKPQRQIPLVLTIALMMVRVPLVMSHAHRPRIPFSFLRDKE